MFQVFDANTLVPDRLEGEVYIPLDLFPVHHGNASESTRQRSDHVFAKMEPPQRGYPMKNYPLAFNASLMPLQLRESPLGVLTVGVEIIGFPEPVRPEPARGAVHLSCKLTRCV